MEWSIQEVARSAGVTARTLRHYDAIGLLPPSRVGHGGLRYYDEDALVRLQRILLLRELGVGLASVGDALDGQRDVAAALRTHLRLLEQEHERLARQITSVQTTLTRMEKGEPLMPDEVLGGFDHTRYQDEVTERWGAGAYRRGDRWWRSLPPEEKGAFQQRQVDIAMDYGRAHASGLAPDSDQVQAITQRHVDWVTAGWQGTRPDAESLVGLGRMYVDDPRFAASYDKHGEGTAAHVRDAMTVYAERNL